MPRKGNGPTGATGTIYLLHFDPPYRHAQHYLGWTYHTVERRLQQHLAGQGSPLVKAAVAAGSTVQVTRTWPHTTRTAERRLKCNGRSRAWLCPHPSCSGPQAAARGKQPPLPRA